MVTSNCCYCVWEGGGHLLYVHHSSVHYITTPHPPHNTLLTLPYFPPTSLKPISLYLPTSPDHIQVDPTHSIPFHSSPYNCIALQPSHFTSPHITHPTSLHPILHHLPHFIHFLSTHPTSLHPIPHHPQVCNPKWRQEGIATTKWWLLLQSVWMLSHTIAQDDTIT